MMREASPEPGGGQPARGALIILAVAVALGGASSLLHVASRPSGGGPGIARPKVVAGPESLASARPAPAIPDAAGPLTIELPALKQLYDASAALVVDARERSQYAAGHIAGAVSLPYDGALADPGRIAALEPARRPIVVYCGGGTCELATELAKFMVQSGKRRVMVFQAGYAAWVAAGYPTARGMAEGVRP